MIYLLTYSLAMLAFVYFVERRRKQTTERFLAANRNVGGTLGAMSIAASWIWAPALFVSTQVGYQWGYSALAWFSLPNLLALMFFGFVAAKIKETIPEGFSYIESLKTKKGKFRETQLTLQMGLQAIIFALQLTAGAELLTYVTGASYQTTVIIMTLLPLAYSLFSGLHSSILTDALQYAFIAIVIICLMFAFPYHTLPDISDNITFDPLDTNMLIQFGIASAVGLFFAIFADHQQWQRIFAIQAGLERRTFAIGAILHFFVTFSLGTFGVLVALSGFTADNPQLAGAEFIASKMPFIFIILFVYMALCGLCSTIDSAFCAFGGLYATEVSKSSDKVKAARQAMLVLAVLGFALAFIRLPILTLWFFAGTFRLAAFAPTVSSILFKRYDGFVGTVSIVSGIIVGGGLFVFGIIQEDAWLRTCGMLTALLLSAGISSVWFFGDFIKKQLKRGLVS